MQGSISTSKRQGGLGLISLIFVGLIIVALLIVGAKLVPAITEYMAIEKAIQAVRNEGETVPKIRSAFDRYAQIDDIKSVKGPRHHQGVRQGGDLVCLFVHDPDHRQRAAGDRLFGHDHVAPAGR